MIQFPQILNMPRPRAFLAALFGLAVIILTSGCQRDISGGYLAGDQSAVCWLQIVRTPDNRLTGQLAVSILKPDGSIERNSISVTGAVDGENVSITGSGFLGLQTVSLSGALSGNTLTLTGTQAIPVIFKRSSMEVYQTQLSDLNSRSQGIIRAKETAQAKQQVDQAQRNFLATIDQLISRMQQFDLAADVHLNRFPGAEKGYQAITAKVAQDVFREHELVGNPNASVTRSQLSVAATQASFLTDQMHYQTQSLESSLQGNVKPIADELSVLEQACRKTAPNGDSLTPMQVQARNAACGRLSDAATPFRQKFNATAVGLAHLEQIYQEEHSKQQQLLREAEKYAQ